MSWPTVIYGVAIATNAAFTNIAPMFYREISHWDLPIQCPFKPEDLKRFVYRVPERSYTLELKSSWFLHLESDVLISFDTPTYRNHHLRAKPGEEAKVSLKQALAIATNLVARLGLPNNVTWVRLKPEIGKPAMPGRPYYEFTWYEPQEQDSYTVRVAVDCRDGTIVSADFGCLYAEIFAKLPATPRPGEKFPPTATTNQPPPPDILQRQLQSMVADLRAWGPKLEIPEAFLNQDWIRQNIAVWCRIDQARQESQVGMRHTEQGRMAIRFP